MTLKEKNYKKRIVDTIVDEYLKIFGAISIEGPKWCGKTWTGLNHANSVIYIDDPASNHSNRTLALISPDVALEGESPKLIDEWQEVPGLWDAVRHTVDKRAEKGCFILTGSATPADAEIMHSGAGRISTIKMRTMSLFESDISNGKISLGNVFNGIEQNSVKSKMDIKTLIDVIIIGGFPGSREFNWKQGTTVAKQYLDRVAKVDISNLDEEKSNPIKVLATIKSLARNNATTVNSSTIINDVKEKDEIISQNTVLKNIRNLKRLFILEEIPGWSPNIRSKSRLLTSPKRLLTDPALVCAALDVSPDKLLGDLNTLGFIFEGLCIRDLLIYSEANGASLFYYRDKDKLEVDIIIEMPDGSWGAIEIKLGMNQVDSAANSLLSLKEKMEKEGVEPPSCLAVIIGVNGFYHKREDGVHVIPIDCLRN